MINWALGNSNQENAIPKSAAETVILIQILFRRGV